MNQESVERVVFIGLAIESWKRETGGRKEISKEIKGRKEGRNTRKNKGRQKGMDGRIHDRSLVAYCYNYYMNYRNPLKYNRNNYITFL